MSQGVELVTRITGIVFVTASMAGAGLDVTLRGVSVVRRVTEVSLLAFFAIIVAAHAADLWGAVGSGVILAAGVFTLSLGAAGYALGGPDQGTRRVVALGSAQRNIAVALVIAGNSFREQPKVGVIVLVVTVVGIVLVFGAAWRFRKADAAAGGAPPAAIGV